MASFVIFANGVALWAAAMVLLTHRAVVRPKRNYFGEVVVRRPDAAVLCSFVVAANIVCFAAGETLMTFVGW